MVAAATSEPSPLTLAEAAFDLVEGNAAEAAAIAERALGLARAARDREAEVAALHALSFALAELGDPSAKPTIRAAIRTAERYGLSRRAGMARRRLSHLLAGEGKISAALHQLDAASAGFDEHERARTYVFRIAVAGMGGRTPPPGPRPTGRSPRYGHVATCCGRGGCCAIAGPSRPRAAR